MGDTHIRSAADYTRRSWVLTSLLTGVLACVGRWMMRALVCLTAFMYVFCFVTLFVFVYLCTLH